MSGITRDAFMRATGSFAGSLILALGADGCANRSSAVGPPPASFRPSVWLSVHPDGTATVTLNRTELGQGVTTGLPTLVAEELDLPLDRMRYSFAPAEPAYFDPDGTMGTGGSDSIASSYLWLRKVGATARAMLVAAAADRWNVPRDTCVTAAGVVSHPPSGRTAAYGTLTELAAKIPVPSHVPLKGEAQFTLIGKPSARLDARPKVDGSGRYGIDVRVPGMRFAAIARPPEFGATTRSFDAEAARRVKGVVAVVEVPSGVAVLATNSWAAFQGRDALKPTWTSGPNADVDSDDIRGRDERLARTGEGAKTAAEHGDVTRARGREIAAVYRGCFLAHATMEPMNATASVTPDGIYIWAPVQSQSRTRNTVARVMRTPVERIHIETTLVGGGFGRRLYTDFVEEAVHVSKAAGMPVQVIWTREDDIQHDRYRPMSVNALRGVLDGGKLVALEHTVVSESIIRGFGENLPSGVDLADMDGAYQPLYDIPNFRASYIDVEHGVPPGAMRAPNANWNYFPMESFVDELAFAAGEDPLAFRLGMLSHRRGIATLETVARRANWGTPATPGAKQGIALTFWNGTWAALVAEVTMKDGKPRVHRVVVGAYVGQAVNPDIVAAQLEGAVMYGLSAALYGKITVKKGRVVERNFFDYIVMRMPDAPVVEAFAIPSSAAPTGIGEVGMPPIAPAVGNAVFALTGRRVRDLPFSAG